MAVRSLFSENGIVESKNTQSTQNTRIQSVFSNGQFNTDFIPKTRTPEPVAEPKKSLLDKAKIKIGEASKTATEKAGELIKGINFRFTTPTKQDFLSPLAEDQSVQEARPQQVQEVKQTPEVGKKLTVADLPQTTLSQAPSQSVWDKLTNWFSSTFGEDEATKKARAMNAYAVVSSKDEKIQSAVEKKFGEKGMQDGKVNTKALIELNKPGGSITKNSPMEEISNELGIRSFPTNSEITTTVMALALGSGLATAPVATIKSIGIFGAVSEVEKGIIKILSGGKSESLADLVPTENTTVKNAVDIVEFIGLGAITHGVTKKSPEIFKALTKDVIKKYKLPETVVLNSQDLRSMGNKNTNDLIKTLKLSPKELKVARTEATKGNNVVIETQELIGLTDKPYWKRVKKMFKLPSTDTEVSLGKERSIRGIAGLLADGEQKPQTIIDSVFKAGMENTKEGKTVIKNAMEAKKTGMNIVIEKAGEKGVKQTSKKTAEITPVKKQTATPSKTDTKKAIQKVDTYLVGKEKYVEVNDFISEELGAKENNQFGFIDAKDITPRDADVVNRDGIDAYKKKILNGDKIEPVIVRVEDGKIITTDGTHRTMAYQELGLKAPVIVTKGEIDGLKPLSEILKGEVKKDEIKSLAIEKDKYKYNYLHNKEKAPSPSGDDQFGQKIEPAGKYMNLIPKNLQKIDSPNFEYGTIEFKKPLVIDATNKLSKEWKTELSNKYNGKTGKELSKAIIKDGYDGIITTNKGNVSETIYFDKLLKDSIKPEPTPKYEKILNLNNPDDAEYVTRIFDGYKLDEFKKGNFGNYGKEKVEKILKANIEIKPFKDKTKELKPIEIEKTAIKKYGTTSNPNEGLFITDDGKMIDGSGKKIGSSGGSRVVDHREVASNAGLGAGSGSDLLSKYMDKTNNVRMSLNGDELAIDILSMPNEKQLNTILRISNGKKIVADISKKDGSVLKSGFFDTFIEYKNFLDKTLSKKKPGVVTDPADVQKIKNAISEGEMILKSGKSSGRKLSDEELGAVLKSVNNARVKIGMEKYKSEINYSTKVVSKVEKLTIKTMVRKTLNADSQEEAVDNLKKFIDENITNTSDTKKMKVLKVMRAEMNKQMYSIAGADTGDYKRDYAYLQILKNEESVGQIINQLEDGILKIDEILGSKMKTPSGFADVGGYSDTVSAKKFFSDMKPIEMPELVSMTKEMLGSVPTLTRFRNAMKLGQFSYRGSIKLNYEIFKDPDLVTKVMAHEMGHMVDWFDQKSLSRRGSNILGRIASVNKYLKHFLKEYPDSPEEIITPKDRIRLRKEAKKMLKEEGVEVTKEVVVGTTKIKPEEVLAIWNSTESAFDKDPELLKYISKLTDYQKKSIVIQAMKGTIPKWVKYERQVKETITEKIFKTAPEDIKAMYEKLVKEEVEKRRLFELKTITEELKYASMKWKPFNPAQDAKFTKYRFSSVELYADAVSIMFNDPALLQELAPNFHKAFFNYLDNKPEAKKVLFSTWDLLNKGQEAVINKRLEDIGNMFDDGEKGWIAKYQEKMKIEKDLMYQLQVLFDDKYTAINRKVNKAIKQGRVIPDDQNPTFTMHELNYSEGKLKNYISDKFDPIYKLTKEIDETLKLGEKEMDGWEMLGTTLLLERAGNERGELANPRGYNPKTAPETLEGMYKKLKPENEKKLKKALKMFRETIQDSLDLAEKNRFYNPELLKEMKANKTYATFQVLDYIDTYISSHVYHQVGTLKDVANPATASLMKLISLHQNIERNNAKKIVKGFMEDNFGDEVQEADTRWNGKTLAVTDPKDPKMGLVTYVLDGKVKGVYIDKDIANSLNYIDNATINMLSKVSKILSGSSYYRSVFTVFNVGFQTVNFKRDFDRYYKNVPTFSATPWGLSKAILRYVQATPYAIKRGFNIDDKLIKEMENNKSLGLTMNDYFKEGVNIEEKQIDRMLKTVGVLNEDHKRMKKILLPIIKTLDIAGSLGNMVETFPKVAGYLELKGKIPEHELAEFIRTSVGSPDFRIGGTATPVSNNFFLFSNAIKEGTKVDIKIAFTKNRSRSGYWFKSMFTTYIPKILMLLAGMGYFGEHVKKIMDKESEYNKSNYNIIPLGLDENDKAVTLRVPTDESSRLFGSIFWKLINIKDSQEDIKTAFADILSFGAGQFPNLSPSFTGIGATIQYLSGKNPYDSFRNRYVIPETEFNAGVEESAPIFLDWLIKNQGAGIVMPKKHYGDTPPTGLEKLIEAPVIGNVAGRWISVTDYGETEKLKDVGKEVKAEKAKKTLDTRRAIDKAIKEYRAGGKNKTVIENELARTVLADMKKDSDYKTKKTALIKKFNISLIRGENDPNMNSLIDARSNDEKIELLISINKNLDANEFNSLLKEARDNKIISNTVIKKYKLKNK